MYILLWIFSNLIFQYNFPHKITLCNNTYNDDMYFDVKHIMYFTAISVWLWKLWTMYVQHTEHYSAVYCQHHYCKFWQFFSLKGSLCCPLSDQLDVLVREDGVDVSVLHVVVDVDGAGGEIIVELLEPSSHEERVGYLHFSGWS